MRYGDYNPPTSRPNAVAARSPKFLDPFRVPFRRSQGPRARGRSLTGPLTEHPNTDCDTLAQVVPGPSERRLPGRLTTRAWDEDDLTGQRVQRRLTRPTAGDGGRSGDDTGFAKPGRCSVGVARRDSGTRGQTGHCQVTVNGHYAGRTIAGPVATRRSLPKPWADDSKRRKGAKVPAEGTSRTKPASARALLDRGNAWGVRQAGVTAEADYGDDPDSRPGLEARRERSGGAVRADFPVTLRRQGTTPPRRVDAVRDELPASAWRRSAGGRAARAGGGVGWRRCAAVG